MNDSERYTQEAEKMEHLALMGATAQLRDGYAALADSYRTLAMEAAHFESRYGTGSVAGGQLSR